MLRRQIPGFTLFFFFFVGEEDYDYAIQWGEKDLEKDKTGLLIYMTLKCVERKDRDT